ncbi:hypothetical protein SAMN05216553_11911 [Lentzea fradiae]|uniref:Uncharacterized protein n=1 Tax=Lentzea fradiae TaxID=200378 RepID=A0A1G8BDG5_9PSEU|nr:hypothetical protein [Lentzea fradiae]SDH31063.1 hypothetical protein SAMN05216553_11911 [Lentzea fradiae]
MATGGVVMGEDEFTVAEVAVAAIARWDAMRHEAGRAGDEQFRSWYFTTVSGYGDPDTFAFLTFEAAVELSARGCAADGFLLLSWLAWHIGREPDGDVVARTVMALTATCLAWAVDRETSAHAVRVLRAVADAVRAPDDVRVERAVCRALSSLGQLSSRDAAVDHAAIETLASPWRELAGRCRGATDPELRGWWAHGMGNEALVLLQSDREPAARRLFAAIIEEFAADPPGSSEDVDVWLLRARHAAGVLDRFRLDEPQLKLDYLERQRHWDRRRRSGRGFVSWLLAGAPRNRMRGLVRRAQAEHRKSADAVRSWLCSGEPFVVLLRNFELTERSGTTKFPLDDTEPADHVQVINLSGAGPALRELAVSVPLVLVASTTAAELELGQDWGQFTAPVKLYLPDETWFDTVSTLLSVADQVVVWAAELTPGLARELDFLVSRQRTEDTLVVLDGMEDPVSQVFLPREGGERLTADHPLLAPFPHVIDATELARRRMAECPSLVRVLQRLDNARNAPLDQRLAEISAQLNARRT